MKNQKILKLTVRGLVQWDKGQTVSIDTTKAGLQQEYYIVQERDDGTVLQYKLNTPASVVGQSFDLSIPDDMLEQANTLTIYGQNGKSESSEMQCISIITLPIAEREKPEDLPVPVSIDTKMLYNAIGEVLDQEGVTWGQYGREFGGNTIGQLDPLKSIVIKLKEGNETTEITSKNQPLLHFDNYNYRLCITYGEELEGKLKATGTTKSGKTYEFDIVSQNEATSNVRGFESLKYHTMVIMTGFNSDTSVINYMSSNMNKSKICGVFKGYYTEGYPYLASNM